jgi:hypothetical protein
MNSRAQKEIIIPKGFFISNTNREKMLISELKYFSPLIWPQK